MTRKLGRFSCRPVSPRCRRARKDGGRRLAFGGLRLVCVPDAPRESGGGGHILMDAARQYVWTSSNHIRWALTWLASETTLSLG
jgi:hypothetical protein